LLALAASTPPVSRGQDAPKAREKAAPAEKAEAPGQEAPAPNADLPGPPEIPKVDLVPVLPTVKVRHDRQDPSLRMVSASPLPRDKEGIWVLDFAFRAQTPLRIRTMEVPGKGRRPFYYLYYKVVNRTGKPRMFVPQFIMVNEEGKKFEDQVIPEAIPLIRAREDQTIPVRGAVDIMGMIPPSTKEGVDDAVFGASVWEKWDPKSDRFSIYVRGLSDGYKEMPDPKGGKPVVKYKTLRIDFIRRGDERNVNEKEIELADPAYEWVYW
jgi:hypothetical protein